MRRQGCTLLLLLLGCLSGTLGEQRWISERRDCACPGWQVAAAVAAAAVAAALWPPHGFA